MQVSEVIEVEEMSESDLAHHADSAGISTTEAPIPPIVFLWFRV